MSLALDFYSPGHSWLHRLDPRVKLWGVFLGMVTTFLLPEFWQQALLLAGVHVVLLGAGVPGRRVGWLWRQMAVLVGFMLILQPFFTPSGASLMILGPLRLTWGGLEHAVLLALRALSMAFITGGVLFTTEQPKIVRAFVRLGLPYTWGLMLTLTLRFLPAVHSLFTTVREAQAARGWVPVRKLKGNFIRRLLRLPQAREYIPVLVAVIIGILRLSDQLTLSLAARGLAAGRQRTVWRDLCMQRWDWVFLVAETGIFLWLLFWRFG